jgi:predicted signal transduction protein with EAL and GGDEF domain
MLARNMGMDVVAEGVETEQQLASLKDLRCEYGQGFFFSHPLDADTTTELLKGGGALGEDSLLELESVSTPQSFPEPAGCQPPVPE